MTVFINTFKSFLIASLTVATVEVTPIFAQSDSTAPAATAAAPSEANKPQALKANIESEIENRVEQFLLRYLEPGAYGVTVNATIKDKFSASLPYVPAARGSTLANMTRNQLLEMVEKMDIKLSVSDYLADVQKKSIEALVADRFPRSSLKIDSLNMKFRQPSEMGNEQLARLEQDLRQLKSDHTRLERERNDIKNELAMVKTMGQQKPPEAAAKPSLVEQAIVPVSVALLAVLGLIVASFLFSSAVKTIGGGIGSIADSVASLGSALGSSGDSKDKEADKPAEDAVAEASPKRPESSEEERRDRLAELHEELMKSINKNNEHILLKFVSDGLIKTTSRPKIVALLEFLGSEMSGKIFTRLPQEQKEAFANFLDVGNFGRPKVDLMEEGAEELKTKLLGELFASTRGKITINIAEKIMLAGDDVIMKLVEESNDQVGARVFVYLDPDRSARLLANAKGKNPAVFKKAVAALRISPEVGDKTELDQQVESALENAEKQTGGNQLQQLRHYEAVLEGLDDEAASEAVSVLGQGDSSVSEYLKRNVITFDTFFLLSPQAQEPIINDVSNKRIAAIVSNLDASRKNVIFSSMSEKKRGMIDEELESFNTLTPQAKQKLYREAREAITATIKKMKESGELDQAMASNPNLKVAS